MIAANAHSPTALCTADGTCDLQGRASLNPITKFPYSYGHIYYPGLFTTADGRPYCQIKGKISDLAMCNIYADSAETEIRKMASPQEMEYAYNAFTFAEKGTPILKLEVNEVISKPVTFHDPQTGIGTTQVGANPKKLANHKAAIQFIEEAFPVNSNFFDQSPEEVLRIVRESHRLLVDGLPLQNVVSVGGGNYRKKETIVKEKMILTSELLFRS